MSTQPGFFSWVGPALRNRRTIKTWIRCCVVLAVTLVLMVDNRTLNTMGQAGFFAAIVAVMLPPSMALSIFVYAAFTLLLGMVLGWAWGCAAMASGLAVRSQALLAQQQQRVQASLVQGVPVAAQLQNFIFHGMYLDPRSSAVWGAFFFIGTFAFGALRAYIPKLTLLSIFGSIVLDIFCSYGPSFPTARYTLPKIFLIPTSYYVVVAIASLILLFPESLNHVWLTGLKNSFLNPIQELVILQSQALNSSPSERTSWAILSEKGTGLRRSLILGADGLLGQITLIDLEISVGRLGPTDLKRINNELKTLMFRAAGLHSFTTYVNDFNATDEQEEEAVEKHLRDDNNAPATIDRYTALRHLIQEREAQHGHDLDSMVPILAGASESLRKSCEAGVRSLIGWFDDCNNGRWFGLFSKLDKSRVQERHAALEARLEELEAALNEFRAVERVKLVKPYERFFDPKTGKLLDSAMKQTKTTDTFALRSLFICFVFIDTLDAFGERLVTFYRTIIELDLKRPKPRFWAPSGFGKLGRKLLAKSDVYSQNTGPLTLGTSIDPTSFSNDDQSSRNSEEAEEFEAEAVYVEAPRICKNPDALPPTSHFGKMMIKLGSILRFFKSPEGIFALRHGVVSLALWIPSVCTSSAWFYYENRGIWALIMAQTSIDLYAGDQIAGFFVRFVGTVIGLLFGMLAWYIGAGHGNGNPYGVVIATSVIVAPLLLGRVGAPPQQMMLWTMAGITVIFVTGYSWINTHQAVLVNTGLGVTLGWKRALLVIIGFTAGFIVMMFPQPYSSRTLVRKTIGAITGEFGRILASEIEAFLAEEARARSGHHEKVQFVGEHAKAEDYVSPKEKRVRKIALRILAVSTRLRGIAPSLQNAKYEPQVQGVWPSQKYQQLYKTHTKLVSSILLLTSAFSRLDTKWCSILVHRTPFLNPNLLSDVFSNIAIVADALSGAHPLPAALPRLRDRVVYHERHSLRYRSLLSPITRIPLERESKNVESESDIIDLDGSTESLDLGAERVDGSSIGIEELSLDVLMDEQLPAHSTAAVALSNIISLIDEMTNITRDLCGEITFQGFNALQQDYLGREEKILGGSLAAKLDD